MESSSQSMSMGTTIGKFSSEFFQVSTPDGRNCTLLKKEWFKRPDSVGGEIIELPAGATSDGATTPAAIWWGGFTPFGPWWKASFIHDWLYRQTHRTKEFCDLVFYEAMVASGVPESRARWFYNGVVEGGFHACAEDRAALALIEERKGGAV